MTSRAVALRVVAAIQVPATILALVSVVVVAVQVSQDALVALLWAAYGSITGLDGGMWP